MKNKFLIDKNHTVAKECGYCSSENCVLNNTLDCLTCSHFVATVDRIPFFRIQIASIDLKINEIKAQHDIESLICIKRLYVKYIEELMLKHYE